MGAANELWNCPWCYPIGTGRGRKPSGWEQQTTGGEWKTLCTKCARRRLNNPWNALLPMRKITAALREDTT